MYADHVMPPHRTGAFTKPISRGRSPAGAGWLVAIARKEVVKVPVEIYWSMAFAPLYQLVKFHQHGKGMPGNGPFALDDKIMNLALDLVLKALKP